MKSGLSLDHFCRLGVKQPVLVLGRFSLAVRRILLLIRIFTLNQCKRSFRWKLTGNKILRPNSCRQEQHKRRHTCDPHRIDFYTANRTCLLQSVAITPTLTPTATSTPARTPTLISTPKPTSSPRSSPPPTPRPTAPPPPPYTHS